MGTLLPAATMFAAASCRKAVLSAAACSKLSGGQRRVFARPAIDALAMMAMPQPGKTWAECARCMRLEPRRLVRTTTRMRRFCRCGPDHMFVESRKLSFRGVDAGKLAQPA